MVLNEFALRRIFKSQFTRGGNILTPDVLHVDDVGITYSRRNSILIGKDEVMLPYTKISSVIVDRKVLGANIILVGLGGERIVARNFSWADARKLSDLVKNYISIDIRT